MHIYICADICVEETKFLVVVVIEDARSNVAFPNLKPGFRDREYLFTKWPGFAPAFVD